jgi:thiamine-monophosphate kinase
VGLLLLQRYVGRHEGSRRSALLAWADRKTEDFRKKIPAGIRTDGYTCLVKHLMPEPRVRSAQLLARQDKKGPSSMIDVSDGLSSDLNQLARASGVHVQIYERRIPVHPSVVRTAEHLGVSAMQAAVSSGEEYELIVTVPPSRLKCLSSLMSRCGEGRLTVIGEVTEVKTAASGRGAVPRRGTVSLISRGGGRSTLTHRGFKHF